MAKKNTKSRYWVDDNSILPEIVITPQGNYPILDEAGNPARTVGAIQDINPNAHIYERVNTQPFMDDYIKGETNTAANQRADVLDATVVPHMGDFVSAATKPLDALMPSRWVGLLDKDYNGLSVGDRLTRLFDENNRGLFINDNPYGLFSKQYAEEHPYWAMAGNTAFDIASTPFIINGAKEAYNVGKTAVENLGNIGKNIADRYLFVERPNTWTRGIGNGREGIDDLIKTGIVRGNPRGTERTAKDFTKLYNKNRDHFRDIIEDTGIKGIESKYQSRTLSEEEFNAIKKASANYTKQRMVMSNGTFTTETLPADPLSDYPTYADYINSIKNDVEKVELMPSRIASGEIKVDTDLTSTSGIPTGRPILERFGPNSDYIGDGTPLSYWYDDGRNPIKKGYDYAGSNYGVRVNNIDDYIPFMHQMHLHPSFFRSPKLKDPNVEVFQRGPFGLTLKLDKETMQPLWKQDLKNGVSELYNGIWDYAARMGNKTARRIQLSRAINGNIANTNLAIGEPAGARVVTYNRQAVQPTTISWDDAVSLPIKITEENAAAITPEQWDAAQRAAWEAGDLAERQRLRNLHFKVRQTGDMIDADGNPIHEYHGSPEENITEFYKPNDPRLPASKGRNVKATGEEGIYTSPKKKYAARYVEDLGGRYRVPLTKEQKELLKAGKTREEIGLPPIPKGRIYDLYSNTKLVPEDLDIDFNPLSLSTEEANLIKSRGYSGFNTSSKKYPEHVVLEPNQLKLADADTFDDAGNLIPLSQRDNFKVKDIRYGFIPWLLGVGTAAKAAYNASQQDNNVKAYGGLLDMANKFKDGGSRNDYNTWKKKIKDYKGIIVDGDDTYDYYNFFKDNPQIAWDMLNNNPEAHFTDKYKTPNHPTYSNESIYSRVPYIQGGTWNDYSPTVMEQKWNYALSPSQVSNNWDVERTINYLANAENEGAYVTDSNGRYPIVDGTVLGGTLTPVTITPNSHSQGGPLRPKVWNDLTIKEKSEMMKVAIDEGITDLNEIRNRYNEYAESFI